jgi:hypothetical protein
VNVKPESQGGCRLAGPQANHRSLPEWLATETAVSFGPSTWHEANNAGAAPGEPGCDEVHRLVVGNMQAASGTLWVHQTYTQTEQANTATVQVTNSGMGEHGGGGLSPM